VVTLLSPPAAVVLSVCAKVFSEKIVTLVIHHSIIADRMVVVALISLEFIIYEAQLYPIYRI
jgi:hypothetical protein